MLNWSLMDGFRIGKLTDEVCVMFVYVCSVGAKARSHFIHTAGSPTKL